MKKYKENEEKHKNTLNEDELIYGHSEAKEEARLREAINRTDEEKFRLFTRMLRVNIMLKNAKITHKHIE
jgi:hypothetical protein